MGLGVFEEVLLQVCRTGVIDVVCDNDISQVRTIAAAST